MVDNSSFFNQLKHIITEQSFRLLNLIPSLCPVCHLPHKGRTLCESCREVIIKAQQACKQCAEPLAVLLQSSYDFPQHSNALEAKKSINTITCGKCQHSPANFEQVIVAGLYQPPLSNLIQSLKFSEQLTCAPVLANLLYEQVFNAITHSQIAKPDALIAVPLHPARLKARGYNQAALIARNLSKMLSIPLLENTVVRVKNTDEQSTMKLVKRKKNIQRAFKVINNLAPHVAIIDDVITTGSTCNELAKTLKKAGINKIDVYAVAKTPHLK